MAQEHEDDRVPTMSSATPGPGPGAGGNGADPSTNHTASLRDPFVTQNTGAGVAPSAIEYFLTFSGIPEEAWIRAGLPLKVLERKRRIIAHMNFAFWGTSDPMGLQYIDLAGYAGMDRKAREEALQVATSVRVMPALDQMQSRFRNAGADRDRLNSG